MSLTSSLEFDANAVKNGPGCLLVTDAHLLITAAVPGQYPPNISFSSTRINSIMDYADHGIPGEYRAHVVNGLPAAVAHGLFDRVWHTYIDYYCMSKIWVDARVIYVGAGGKPSFVKEYGFEDGEDTLIISVYCREYWEALGNPDPAQSDWSDLMSRILSEDIAGPLALAELEDRLAAGLASKAPEWLIVAQPSDTEDGFTARGFRLI